jgi:hypothetical protein
MPWRANWQTFGVLTLHESCGATTIVTVRLFPWPSHRIQTDSGKKMGLCRLEAAEGDVRTKLEASCTGSQTARRPERGTLNSCTATVISEQPCRVIGQIEGLCLKVHVNTLKDRHILVSAMLRAFHFGP